MMINRSLLKFHETFQPESAYLAKILDLASQSYSGTKFEISDITGIPTGKQKGKVEPHIKYASYMGLVDYNVDKGVYHLSLTELGNEVFVQDKFLHETLTQWICHYEISRKDVGAPQWAYIVHNGHSGYYQDNSSSYHLDKATALFSTDVYFEEMFGVVKRSYTDGFFSGINYLKWEDSVEYIEHSENPELVFVYALAILDSWKRMFPQKSEITITELLEVIEFGKIFNVNEEEVDGILDSLCNEGLLRLNRQLYPPTVIATANSDEVICNLYNRLL